MKAILISACLLLGFAGCNAQGRRVREAQHKSPVMEQFNIERFNANKTAGHALIRQRDGSEIEQWESAGDYYIEETRPAGSSFSAYKLFYYDSGRLKLTGRQFFRNKVGTWERFDEAGKLVESIDYDRPYRFSIDQLNEKMRKLGVDIITPGPGVGVVMEPEPQPTYTVIYPVSPTSDAAKNLMVVDGVNGRTLQQRVVERTKD